MPEPEKIEMTEMANRLEVRRSNNHRTVLVLGSRAGGLFRSQHFYDTFKLVGPHDFTQLSRLQQFAECYHLLVRNRFSEAEIHNILHTSLDQVDIGGEDICIAELVQQGYFDQVISTNVDDLLERAFTMIKVREVEVLVANRKSFSHRELGSPFKISKAFGDLASMEYSILQRATQLEKDIEFKEQLEHNLAEDILIIGFDPVWDEELLHIIPANHRSLWLICEDKVIEHPLLSRLANTRHVRYIEGGEGSYARFSKALHWHLTKSIPMAYQLTLEIRNELGQIHAKLHEILKLLKIFVSDTGNQQRGGPEENNPDTKNK
jgi:hypothetical protein